MQERADLGIKPGDTVRVWQKITEQTAKGEKTRLQAFEGLVLARKHGNEAGGTFTVRRVTGGIGIEKIFPLYAPMIDKIEIVKRSKVRRAKLYYIREKVAREVKRQLRRMKLMAVATKGGAEIEAEEKAAQEAADASNAEQTQNDAETDAADEAAPADTEASVEETATEEALAEEEKTEAPVAEEEKKEN